MAAVPSEGRAAAIGVPHEPAAAEATHALYERYGQQIYRFCLQRLRNREEAEDAAQTTFLNAFRSLERGVSVEFESAWLYKIALHVCLTKQRSSNLRRLVEAPSDTDAIEEQVPAREQDTDELFGLDAALRLMPDQQRRAFLLREWQGLSYKEIGDELRLSQSAVETLLFRARRSLADALVRDPNERRGRGRPRKLTSLSSAVALIKPLLVGGGAKVVAVVATVAATSVVATAPAVRQQLIDAIAPSAARPARHGVVRRTLTPPRRAVRTLLRTTVSTAPAPARRSQGDPDLRTAADPARTRRIAVEPAPAPPSVGAPSVRKLHVVTAVSPPSAQPVPVPAPQTASPPAVDAPTVSGAVAGEDPGPLSTDPTPAPPAASPVASTVPPAASPAVPSGGAPTGSSTAGSPTTNSAPSMPAPLPAASSKAPVAGGDGSVRLVQAATVAAPAVPAPVVQSGPPPAPASLPTGPGSNGADAGSPARPSVPPAAPLPATVKTQFVLGAGSGPSAPAPPPGTNSQPLQAPSVSSAPSATVAVPPVSQGITPPPVTATTPTTPTASATVTAPPVTPATPVTPVVVEPLPSPDDWSGHGNGHDNGNGHGHGKAGRADG